MFRVQGVQGVQVEGLRGSRVQGGSGGGRFWGGFRGEGSGVFWSHFGSSHLLLKRCVVCYATRFVVWFSFALGKTWYHAAQRLDSCTRWLGSVHPRWPTAQGNRQPSVQESRRSVRPPQAAFYLGQFRLRPSSFSTWASSTQARCDLGQAKN